ncbi:MAG: universal stress protein [Ilumatobacteraceae bacterium]
MNRILVGIDGSKTSQAAARQAVELAEKLGAEVHFVTVVKNDDATVLKVSTDEWEISNLLMAESNVRQFIGSLRSSVPYTVAAIEGSPAKAIVTEAERVGADLIVVGNVRMQGVSRVLGSVGNSVAHTAPCSVLIVKTV